LISLVNTKLEFSPTVAPVAEQRRVCAFCDGRGRCTSEHETAQKSQNTSDWEGNARR
jgi:hypothetical protein